MEIINPNTNLTTDEVIFIVWVNKLPTILDSKVDVLEINSVAEVFKWFKSKGTFILAKVLLIQLSAEDAYSLRLLNNSDKLSNIVGTIIAINM